MDSYDGGQPVNDLVHPYLKYVLAHLQTEGHKKKSVYALMGIVSG